MMKFSTLATIALLAITAQALPSFHDEEIDAVVPEMDLEEVPPPLGKKAVALVQGSGASPDGSKKGGEGEPCKAECDDCKPLCEAVCDPKALSFLQAMGDGGDDDGPPAACKKCIDENKDKCGDCLACHMAEHAKEAGGKGGKGGSKKAPDGSKKAKPKKAKASALVETPPVMDAATTFRATFGQLLQGPGGGGAAQSANDGKKLANDCDLKAVKPGKSTVSCNGIAYDFHVPKDGCDGKCGLIMDVHGSGMNAAMEEASSGIAKYANPQGYVVIQPSSADADFSTSKDKDGNLDNGWAEIDDMVAFLRLVVAEASDMIDAKKVHMAGFSQGAFVAWNALCRASDLICSIAPTGFNAYGEYDQGIFKALGLKQVTHSNCWLDAKGPKIPRSIWYASGKHDILGGPALFKKSMDSVKKAYGLGNGVEKQTDFSGAEWTQYPTLPQGVNVESTLFDYESPAVWPGVGAIKGHCFPSSQTGGAPAFPMTSCGGPGAYSWGKEAVNFFKANPCQDKAA